MVGNSQQPVFGIPPGRGGGRGRGSRGARGGGGFGGRRQPLPLGGDDMDIAMADGFPGGQLRGEAKGNDGTLGDHGGSYNSTEFRNDAVQLVDQIDSKLGFERHQEGPTRLGWLVNMHATSVPDEERSSAKAAVDYYFLEQDGGSFKCTLLYKPYFYIICTPGSETEVEEWLVRRFDRFVDDTETVEREDLGMANHLTGCKRKLVKIVFRNVQDLLSVRRELQPIIKRNEKRSDLMNAYNDNGDNGLREVEDSLLEMREFDVPYYLRVAIDKCIRVGVWYDVSAEAGEITLTRREDLVQRADPVVFAFDIETTKLPLKFPDANIDMIMMISYMIDGQGYLITNREVVSEDIEDFEYTPTREFPGPFIIFNEPDERAVILRFFDHIRDAKPTVLATYNGDFFDWPFVDTRAKHYGIDMNMEIGWYRDETDEYKCRSCVHMDCLRWVKRDSYLPVGSQGLKAVTTAKLGYNPMEIDPEDMTRFAAEEPQTLAQYSVSDAVATYYLYMKYVHPFIFSLCNIIPLNPDEVLRKGSGTLCETLLMVEAFNAKVAIPNKHADPPERTWDGHLIETETYVGGHVEALEAGVFRSDINMHFRLVPEGLQQLLDELDRALKFSIEVEGKLSMDDIENYDEVRGQIAAKLEDLRDKPVRSEPPLIYHLDVAAMYPNIILTNRLQPDAIVDESVCASCDFNVPGKDCDRRMPWLWRGEFFPPKRGEVNMLRGKLQGELFPADGRAKAGAPSRTFDQLSAADQATELHKRVKDYSKKVYHRLRETKIEEREAVICQRENPFYVDTVRNFRDRRYVYKGLLKKEKRKLDDATAQGDNALIDSGKKLVVLYDSLQLAHKCILNSFYGYVMRKGARWHSLEMAGVVCLTGSRIIQMARQRVEQLGRPLELDTDGIWCTLPGSFPENYSFKLKDGKGRFGVSYPCTMLNHLVFDKFTNHQYQDLVDTTKHLYSSHSENSIFFEVDGPYRAMILPSSKEEDKLLKKRYAVFNDDGSLAELKGFEVKRRGELKLIKIFQSQIFKVFLQGSTLEECYGSVAKVADQWLDILFSQAKGLPDDELFDLITENRSMSKALESYGAMKSTSICTARRLAEFLGDQMVKDKGLACKFVISRLPRDQPVSERAVPVAIFSADPATKRQFLRRWLRDSTLDTVDIRDILDWDYYLERFGSVIQKLITIPAAMQGVSNPVPRILHPDWLSKRVSAALNKHKQRHITDVFKKVSKQEYLDKAVDDDAKMREEASAAAIALGGDIEDLGISGSSAAPRPKTGVVRKSKSKRNQDDGLPRTVDGLVARLSELGSAPSPSDGYAPWLAHSKKIWALSRRLRVVRQKAVENGDEAPDSNWRPSAAGADGIGQYFARSSVTLSRGVWNILQWSETDTPGELKAWVLLGSQLHAVKVSVPRVLYVTSTVPRQEISDSRFFTEAKSMVLPRTSYVPNSMHLYKSVMTEAEYIAYQSSWSSFFAHPSIGGVYETEVTPLDRALIQLGATAWMSTAARQMHAGRGGGLGDVVSLDDLDTRRTSLTTPHGLGKQMWKARDLSYALLYHAGSSDGRQFFALVMPYMARGHVWVVNTNQQAAQLQIPNLERLYRESYAAARAAVAESGASTFDDGAFAYPEAIEFTSQAFATTQGAYRSINAAVAKCADEKRGSTVLIYHSSQPAKRLRSFIRSISELPTISVPVHQADTVLPAIDWQRHACRRMVASLLNCSQWVDERISLSQYADVPVGNIPADAPMFLADVFFARKLSLAKHILWWSPSSKPDLGGRQDDEFNELASDGNDGVGGFATSIEINVPGSYSTACVEIELKGLVVNTILKAPLVNEIEGAFGVFGFDSMAGGTNDTAALLGDDDVADGATAERNAAGADSDGAKDRGRKKNKKNGKDAEADSSAKASQTSILQEWAASGTDGNVPVSTFQLLRSLLRGWCQEMDAYGNPFAEMMAEHFYRWLTRPNARLFDPALAYLVRSLMRKVFLQMKAELQKLGARIVYANIDKLIVTTGKASVASAQAAIAYITKAIVEKPLFESMTLAPLQYWTFLLWMNASNYGGIVVQQQQPDDSADQAEAVVSGEPRIEMLWNMKEYLPVVVQSHFELAIAEFIYKLASFHAQLHTKNPHAAHGAGNTNGQSEIIEDNLSDSEQVDSVQSQKSNSKKGPKDAVASDSVAATKGAFYKRLIGQYFTRKLLDTVGQIRDACSSAHRNDPDTMFPRLPGSKLYLRGARTEAALEFVKYVSTVFALDVPATNFVRIMRRNLLALLSVGEFSEDAQFTNPCERLVLPRVVCDFCNFCRDMDFCRDADLLPAQVIAEDGSNQANPPEWQCLGCGSAYDRVRIEERLIEQLRALVLSYQMQDLVCSKCRLMKQDNFSLQCASCAGKYKPAVSADSIRTQIAVYRDVALMNGLPMLLDLANWAHDNARVAGSSAN
ncbi:DNA polymerase epsilon catalytic subunit [Coemansia sp. RSA 1813]|nr:DNA polymerase epsilon catalytic subunit [Coemansia sp. RSA 1646]KAJ1773226.1 DNA polymerase epsilon catalytic subunit [Coemansia sp. RSA 1843]KAJ2092694.1 DNA polymerase epsilon catalytic subunit [Coemansia sp. RSA 986]KAJ2217809.1 DNA polymerase epsilon catalytic subunit [Coemansia sp. RSA 487]KAJ2572956.1 DNA polymerase epsilon catalytic subunit [Coemansia sp. RSA 1813]